MQTAAHFTAILCRGLISMMRPAVFFAEEVTAKPTALNSPPPLLRWFYRQTKLHTAMHYIGVMLFTDWCLEAPKIENQYVASNVDIVADRHK